MLKALHDNLGIPREEATKLSYLEAQELLLAFKFVVENEQRKIEDKKKEAARKVNPKSKQPLLRK